MGSSAEKEFEEQLREAGNSLLSLPSSIDQLLNMLDKVEHLLANVEQAPSRSMQDALLPIMKALIAEELLRHPDMDVKVSVASCFNEVTRITAPDNPYDDKQMKEIFALIVAAFENLSHKSNRCYNKAVSILETVAKVRSSLVMLDLECDALIIEMFQHFLKIIRPDHPPSVFSAMEIIMTMVLNESEDISLDLLSPILASVRKEIQNVLPISWKLAEKVITNCADKLKPSLIKAVQSTSIVLDDYAAIVARTCQTRSDTIEHEHAKVFGEHLEDGNKPTGCTESSEPSQVNKGPAPDTTCSSEFGEAVDGISKSAMSNGTALIEGDNTISESSSKTLERCCLAQDSKTIDAGGSAEPDDLASMKTVKSETETETVPKKRGRKPNSLMNPEEGYDQFWICTGRKSPKVPRHRKSSDKKIPPSANPVSNKAALPSTHEKVSQPLGCSPEIGEVIGAASPSTKGGLPDGSCRKRGRPRKTECIMSQDRKHKKKSKLESTETNREATLALGYAVPKKETEDPADPEERPLQQSVTNVAAGNVREDKLPVRANLEISTVYPSGKKNTEASDTKDIIYKHATKSSNRGESNPEETPKTKSPKRGRPAKNREASNIPGLDERLVGSRIKVWWPLDKMFYEGIVDDFDPIRKKHKVVYADGDQEILNLNRQTWEIVGDDVLPDGGQETDLPKTDVLSDLLQKGNGKRKSGSAKQVKVDSSSKRSGASASVSKVEAVKSGGISADRLTLDKPIVDESMDDSHKSAEKLKRKEHETGLQTTPKTPTSQKSTKKLKVTELKTNKQTASELDKPIVDAPMDGRKKSTEKLKAKELETSLRTIPETLTSQKSTKKLKVKELKTKKETPTELDKPIVDESMDGSQKSAEKLKVKQLKVKELKTKKEMAPELDKPIVDESMDGSQKSAEKVKVNELKTKKETTPELDKPIVDESMDGGQKSAQKLRAKELETSLQTIPETLTSQKSTKKLKIKELKTKKQTAPELDKPIIDESMDGSRKSAEKLKAKALETSLRTSSETLTSKKSTKKLKIKELKTNKETASELDKPIVDESMDGNQKSAEMLKAKGLETSLQTIPETLTSLKSTKKLKIKELKTNKQTAPELEKPFVDESVDGSQKSAEKLKAKELKASLQTTPETLIGKKSTKKLKIKELKTNKQTAPELEKPIVDESMDGSQKSAEKLKAKEPKTSLQTTPETMISKKSTKKLKIRELKTKETAPELDRPIIDESKDGSQKSAEKLKAKGLETSLLTIPETMNSKKSTKKLKIKELKTNKQTAPELEKPIVDESMDDSQKSAEKFKGKGLETGLQTTSETLMGKKSTKKLKVKELKTNKQTAPKTLSESKAETPGGGSESHGASKP